MESTEITGKTRKTLAGIIAFLSAVVAAMWAIITYVFPDPTIFGLGIINWKNLLSFVAAFVFLSALVASWRASGFPKVIRGALNLLLAAGLSISFFIIGMEYAKPSFEFARRQNAVVENDGPTLLGERLETIDNVRIRLIDCRITAQTPSCIFEIISTNRDREIKFDSDSRLFEPAGSGLKVDHIVIGNTPNKRHEYVSLVRNLSTRVTLIFEPTREQFENIPSVKLVMHGLGTSKKVIKFSDVGAQ